MSNNLYWESKNLNSLMDEVSSYFNSWGFDVKVPEGYELRETPAHKKQRLESSIQEKKQSLSGYEKRIAELSSQIEQEEKSLLELSKEGN
jgi:flagellar hook-associated protein FlgK